MPPKTLLLLVNAEGVGTAHELLVRQFRAFAGEEGVSVHFRPVRNDALFHSAKIGSGVAYRVLLGEGLVRSQIWVEYELCGPPVNVAGRSGDLLFALALLTSAWKGSNGEYPAIAATGVLDTEEALISPDSGPAVTGVDGIESKMTAAVAALAGERAGLIFYPAADRARVDAWCATAALPRHIRIHPVATLEDALSALGIRLEKVYLGNPYRGLEYFDYGHRSVFFGRDAESRELTEQLLRREQQGAPGVLVEGASGSGKSSFIRAGVLPVLVNPRADSAELERALAARPVPESVSRAIWHPGLVPAGADEQALARSIHGVWSELAPLCEHRDASPGSFAALVQLWRAAWPDGLRFVWIIDQLEELFNLGLTDALIESLGAFLLALQAAGAWTLAGIRADAVPHLKHYGSFRQVFGSNEGQYYLPGLGPTALDEVICRPAQAAGLTFGAGRGGRRLDRVLREDAYQDPQNALPLLQLTLYELYRRRCGREVTFAAYEEIGGLSGAVATIASAALAHAPQSTLLAASGVFRALVSVDDSGAAIRRYASRAEFAEVPAQEQLIAALVNARLCVSTEREGEPVVALAHEALLGTWPQLVEWLREESRLLQLRELAEHDARLWQQHARADTWLAASSRLAALEPLETAGIRLSGRVRDFLRHSRQRTRRIERLKQASIATVALLAIAATVTGIIAVSKQREARSQAVLALHAEDQARIEAATARATARFLSAIFNAPTPEGSLGRLITARELLDEGARRLRSGSVAAPEVRARLTEQIGNAYREIGAYHRAAPLLQSAIRWYRALPKAPPEDRAEAYTALGRLDASAGEWPSAKRALSRAMALQRDVPPARRSAMPDIVLAQIEARESDFTAAKASLGKAAAILRSRAQASDPQAYLLLMGYSRLYLDQGNLPEARQYGLQALRAQTRILGPDDPSAIGVEFRLGDVYLASGDAALAARYDGRAVELAAKLYGRDSPEYARMLDAHATDLHYLGHDRETERLLREVLRIRLRTLGPGHRLTGQAYLNLGSTLGFLGHWRGALSLTTRAAHILASAEGPESPDAAFALVAEARILRHLGRPAAAVPLVKRALRISQRPGHPDPARAVWEWLQLGKAYAALGSLPAAADALRHSINVYQHLYGDQGEPLAQVLTLYGKVLERQGQSAGARAVLARAALIRHQRKAATTPTLNLRPN